MARDDDEKRVQARPRVQNGGLNPEVRRRFEQTRQSVPSKISRHIQAVRESERLTQEDFSIRINTEIDTPIQADE